MNFSDAVRSCLSKYATFTGRAPRAEYWFFWLFSLIAEAVGRLIDVIGGIFVVSSLISLALFLPGLAVFVRRMHDIDRTGWWVLLTFLPGLIMAMLAYRAMSGMDPTAGTAGTVTAPTGPSLLAAIVTLVIGIVLLIWSLTRGTPGPNRFGPDPLAGTTVAGAD